MEAGSLLDQYAEEAFKGDYQYLSHRWSRANARVW